MGSLSVQIYAPMADRLASAFSPFDVLAITLAGAFVIAGAWWGIDGVPAKAPSAAGVVGLVAASYVAGHLVGAASALLGFSSSSPAPPATLARSAQTVQPKLDSHPSCKAQLEVGVSFAPKQ
jgi:hypothetical protein